MFQISRRNFIQTCFAFASGLISMNTGFAARLTEHFSHEPLQNALDRLFGHQEILDTDQLRLQLPDTAENGAVVPIIISSELQNIQRIYLLVEKNPTPLAAEFELTPWVSVYISARIKMAESCHVLIIAQQESQLFKTRQWVNVVQGGCGTG